MSPSQQPGGAAAGPLINFLVAYEGSGRGHHLRAPLTDGFSHAATLQQREPLKRFLHLHFKAQQPVAGLQLCSCFVLNSTTSEPSRVTNGRHSVESVALGNSFWGAKRPFDKLAMSAFQRTSCRDRRTRS